MTTEDQLCDDILKIIVRKNEYTVSKKLICSSVPYFEKMFCCDLLESKENKVELDFDERVFTSILNWVHSGTLTIHMDYVISLYDAVDYLMIDQKMFQSCFTYFHEKFTIAFIPSVLHQVTRMSKLINSEAIANFVCRHFLMIANATVFLDYPVEVVVAILKLDLMIYSEYQIFGAIVEWIQKDFNNRNQFIDQLLKCVRWSTMNSEEKKIIFTLCVDSTIDGGKFLRDYTGMKIFSKEIVKRYVPYFVNHFFRLSMESDSFESNSKDLDQSQSHLSSSISANSANEFNRCKQNFFISIQQKDDSKLWLNIYDNEFSCTPIGDFELDNSMSLEFVHGEHISDILFDSGSKGVRIDWIKKKFKWIEFSVKGKTYYSRLNKSIGDSIKRFNFFGFYNLVKKELMICESSVKERFLLEYNGEFIGIGKTKDGDFFVNFNSVDSSCFIDFENHDHSFQATVLSNIVYILTKDLKFCQIDIECQSLIEIELFKDDELDYNNLILTSQPKNDHKIIVIDKLSGKVFIYCVNRKEWIYECQIININFYTENLNANSNKLIGFTSTFLPIKIIKPLYDRKFIS